MQLLRSIALCALVLALTACASTPSGPINDTNEGVDGLDQDSTIDQIDLEDAQPDELQETEELNEVDDDNEGDDELDTPDTEDDAPIHCVPNNDGIITRQEVPIRVGLRATFRVATDVPVDLVGSTEEGSERRSWDFTGPYQGDHSVLAELRPVSDFWFADDFPDATYATPLSDSSDLLGVFQLTDDALLLLGVASPEDGFIYTRLSYSPPVTVLSFPFELGDTWTTDATFSGILNGGIWTQSEEYTSSVDAAGSLTTAFGTFEILRVRTDLDRLVGFYSTQVRTFGFVAECFGTVATVSSEDDPDEIEFTQAAEIRRLSP
ncbi:MAG: hypothetical protein RBU37_05585 [Myxococcota bacterium]|jgi:hypothetical protein|nr:hypothetical protein [Myxococcota bacterium]